jgi:hypothetical protein
MDFAKTENRSVSFHFWNEYFGDDPLVNVICSTSLKYWQIWFTVNKFGQLITIRIQGPQFIHTVDYNHIHEWWKPTFEDQNKYIIYVDNFGCKQNEVYSILSEVILSSAFLLLTLLLVQNYMLYCQYKNGAWHEGHHFLYRTDKSSSCSAGKPSAPAIFQDGIDDDEVLIFPEDCSFVCKMFVF